MIPGLPPIVRRVVTRAAGLFHPDRRLVATEFDRRYYLSLSPDIVAAGADPLHHFLTHGWREGRDPNPNFSVRGYLHEYPEVAETGINPFVHYLRHGRREGRGAGPDLGFRYDIIARQRPIEDQIADAAKATLAQPAGDTGRLVAGLAKAQPGLARLHVTFSHDDYRTNVGGVQLCLQIESARVAEQGRDHLHIFPVAHWPVMRDGEGGRLGVLLNGQHLGAYAQADVAAALREAAGRDASDRSVAIHSLLGHSAADTLEILEALRITAGFLWLHDYSSLCAGYNLLRNGVEDCAAPPPESAACGICAFGPWRSRHLVGHEQLFGGLELTVVSPAQVTLDFWKTGWRFPAASHVVHPHAKLVERAAAPLPSADRPLRVAFLGYPVAHKGWPLFKRLVARYADDPRYDFFHLGAQQDTGVAAEFHEVRVAAGGPNAMQQALERLEIDVVLLWPLWRETFSFAVYEALAAGCAVATGPDSGNVAAVVAATAQGVVLADDAAVEAAFESADMAKLSRAQRKPMLYDLTLSGMTADLLPARAEA
jgi:glycosyltransferase involved in cell wall biosynthesis